MINQEELKLKINKLFEETEIQSDKGIKNLDKIILNYFNSKELNYINKNKHLLSDYLNIKINVKYIETDKLNLLKTDIGTFCLRFGYKDIKVDKFISDNKIKLLDLYGVFQKFWMQKEYDIVSINKGRIDNPCLIKDLLEVYSYYKSLITKNIKNIRYIYTNIGYQNFWQIPLELFDNPNFYFYTYDEIFLKDLNDVYNLGYKFDNNCRLMFLMIIYSNNLEKIDFIKENIKDFKQFILDNKFNEYAKKGYMYLKENLRQYMNYEFLLELYKKAPRFFEFDNDVFETVAKSIINDSPLVNLDKSSKVVHIKYDPFDLYEDEPSLIYSMKASGKDVIKISDFESRFLMSNELVVKLYEKYYKSYKNSLKDENKDNLYDFIRIILFNYNNLVKIINNPDFSIDEIKQLSFFAYSYNLEEKRKFDIFMNKYIENERNKRVSMYNEFVKCREDSVKLKELINNLNLTEDNIYSAIINDKFIPAKLKTVIINIINMHYGNCLKVIDIINILDEMLDRGITIEEILEEKEIEKNFFYKLYEQASENNPILYEYINNSLSQNKRNGYKKLIKLGLIVLSSDISSLEEYNSKFPEYDFEELTNGLSNTEVGLKLLEKANNWNYKKGKI